MAKWFKGGSERSQVGAFRAMDILAQANALEAAGRSIVHLEIGQPSGAVPEPVIAAARDVLSEGRVAYTEATGLPALRERIAEYYRDVHRLEISPERIVVTAGSSAAFQLLFVALFSQGDRIGMTRPYYPAYPNILKANGLTPVLIDTDPATGYGLDRDAFLAAMDSGLEGLLLASPANPTGTVLSADELAWCTGLAREAGIPLICDEIYHGIVFGNHPAPTALAFDDEAIIVNSFSKYFCMAGWRIGWAVVPEDLVRVLERLGQSLFVAPPTLGQLAACEALLPENRLAFDGMVAGYEKSRKALFDRLPAMGFTGLSRADGAFYLYADITRFGMDSVTFCRRLLDEAGVAITPGLDFDHVDGQHTVRLSFAGSCESVAEGLDRMEAWCKTLDQAASGARGVTAGAPDQTDLAVH